MPTGTLLFTSIEYYIQNMCGTKTYQIRSTRAANTDCHWRLERVLYHSTKVLSTSKQTEVEKKNSSLWGSQPFVIYTMAIWILIMCVCFSVCVSVLLWAWAKWGNHKRIEIADTKHFVFVDVSPSRSECNCLQKLNKNGWINNKRNEFIIQLMTDCSRHFFNWIQWTLRFCFYLLPVLWTFQCKTTDYKTKWCVRVFIFIHRFSHRNRFSR